MKIAKTERRSREFSWFVTVLLCLLLLQITGCASVPEGSSAMKQQALSFTPPSEKAGVYAIRPYNYVGSGVLYEIILDHQEFGSLATKSYLFAVVPPGIHILHLPYDGGSHVMFIAEAGKNYFFTVKPGWAWLQINTISEADGKAYVLKYKLSGDYMFGNTIKTEQTQ
jgi:hypothetical protein